MAKLCTLIATPAVIIEGSTYDILDKRASTVICHDGINRFFRDVDKDAVGALVVHVEYPPIEGEENYIDRLANILGPILYAEDRTQPIVFDEPILSQLYRHPLYQAFCEEHRPTKEELTNINKEP